MTEPVTTKAGRTLLDLLHELLPGTGYSVWIAAIEAEARRDLEQRLATLVEEWADDDEPTWRDQVPYLFRTEVVDRLRALLAPHDATATPGEKVVITASGDTVEEFIAHIDAIHDATATPGGTE